MALYREGKAAMAADGTVTGAGTKWQSSLSLIRPGATIMFLSSPIQMAVVNKVVSDTEIKAITTKGAVVASTDYAILLSDSLTVDGLAQDVAETLRYYQSQETVIAEAVEFFKDFNFEALQNLANQIKEYAESAESSAAAAAASENAAKNSETNSKASEVAAETARDQVQQIINDAGEQSTLVVLAQPTGAGKSGLTQGGTVQDGIQYLTPEIYLNSGLYSGVTAALNQMVIDAAASSRSINAGGGIYNLTSGQTLRIEGVEWFGGTLIGTGATVVQVKNARLERLKFSKCNVRHVGGDFVAKNIRAENSTATAAILIGPLDSPGIVDIDGLALTNNNYGILGQGASGSPVTRISLNHIYAKTHKGDPIELNLVQSWGRKEIRNVMIDGVTGTGNSNDFWGIGIGIAGAGNYALETPDSDMASDILIENVVAIGCRQPIHLEKSRDFTVRGVRLYPDSSINTLSGLVPTGVSIVGCREFTIENFDISPVSISNTPAITTSWGVVSGAYTGPCRNFTIRNGTTSGRLSIYTGASSTVGSDVDISDVTANGAGSFIKGYVSNLRVKGLKANALTVDMAHTTGEGVGMLTRNSQITCYFDGVISQDENNAPNGTALHIYADILDVRGCNFPIIKSAVSNGGRGALVQPGRIYLAPGTTFPVGHPFVQGDRVYKSSTDPSIAGGGWLVTKSGALVNSNDAIKEAAAGQNYIEANTAGLNWASTNTKSAGLQITIPGAGVDGADLNTVVTRAPFVSGGVYRVTINPAIVTAVPAGTVIYATNPIETVEFS